MTRAPVLALALALTLSAPPTLAIADGDPASDVLLGQDVFLPYASVSRSLQRGLYAITEAARNAGYPVKIALIGAKSDLGVLPSLLGQPQRYAQFLSTELSGAVSSPVLVVMPDGFGLALDGRTQGIRALDGVPIPRGADGLGAAALSAVQRLAAAAGHPLPPGAARVDSAPGASPSTVRHALTAIAVLIALAAAGVAIAMRLRLRT